MFGAKGDGINSYIVGCKYNNYQGTGHFRKELIVTQWDVNLDYAVTLFGAFVN